MNLVPKAAPLHELLIFQILLKANCVPAPNEVGKIKRIPAVWQKTNPYKNPYLSV